jgi:hypothetical protein
MVMLWKGLFRYAVNKSFRAILYLPGTIRKMPLIFLVCVTG